MGDGAPPPPWGMCCKTFPRFLIVPLKICSFDVVNAAGDPAERHVWLVVVENEDQTMSERILTTSVPRPGPERPIGISSNPYRPSLLRLNRYNSLKLNKVPRTSRRMSAVFTSFTAESSTGAQPIRFSVMRGSACLPSKETGSVVLEHFFLVSVDTLDYLRPATFPTAPTPPMPPTRPRTPPSPNPPPDPLPPPLPPRLQRGFEAERKRQLRGKSWGERLKKLARIKSASLMHVLAYED